MYVRDYIIITNRSQRQLYTFIVTVLVLRNIISSFLRQIKILQEINANKKNSLCSRSSRRRKKKKEEVGLISDDPQIR